MNKPTKPYRWKGKRYDVDSALDPYMLDGLNSLPGLRLYQVCAGHSSPGNHSTGVGEPAHAMFYAKAPAILAYASASLPLHGLYHVQMLTYRTGLRGLWTLELRPEGLANGGEQPKQWWLDILRTLADFRP